MTAAHNRRAWDEMAARGQRFTRAAADADFANPLATVDQVGWLGGDICGKRLLCLAAGGGKHGPLYAAAGAIVTVVDLSPAQLELDRTVAAERRLQLRTVEAAMDAMPMLQVGEFDMVIQPVSTWSLSAVGPVSRERRRTDQIGLVGADMRNDQITSTKTQTNSNEQIRMIEMKRSSVFIKNLMIGICL